MRAFLLPLVLVLLLVLVPPVSAVSGNDDIANAVLLQGSGGEQAFDTIGATDEAGEPFHAGYGFSAVWFHFTPYTDGVLTLDTRGSDFDTVLAVYEGNTLDGLVELSSSDNVDYDGRPDWWTSRLQLWLVPFQRVSIAVGGALGEQGAGRLAWSFAGFDEAPQGDVTRVAGADTVQTALALSRLAFGDGGSPSALLARADVFADTLAGGGLAGAQPLLLTPGDVLDDAVAAELERIDASDVAVLGGPAAVGDAVLDQLAERGIDADRLAGATRIETAVAVAERVLERHGPTTALLARAFPAGEDATQAFADSIAAGAWAADEGWPVLLTDSGSLSTPTAAHLADAGYDRVILIGGAAALSPQVATEVGGFASTVERVAGATRYDTAVAITQARGATGVGAVEEIVVVDGVSPDAWAGGLAAASYSAIHDAPVLLAAADRLPPATVEFLSSGQARAEADAAAAVCVASDAACDELEARLADPDAYGVPCHSMFEHVGYTGCHSDLGGFEVKFFPLPEGTQVRRLVIYFHGDGGEDWSQNDGFDQKVLDWAHPQDMLVLGFKATSSHPGNPAPAYGGADPSHVAPVAAGIAYFADKYEVVDTQSLYWGDSGGAVFLSGLFIPVAGDRMPGLFALSCGGAFLDHLWHWDPRSHTAARNLITLLFNYGDQDFLAEQIAEAHDQYLNFGFSSAQIIHPGATHCDHPRVDPTIEFWDTHLP